MRVKIKDLALDFGWKQLPNIPTVVHPISRYFNFLDVAIIPQNDHCGNAPFGSSRATRTNRPNIHLVFLSSQDFPLAKASILLGKNRLCQRRFVLLPPGQRIMRKYRSWGRGRCGWMQRLRPSWRERHRRPGNCGSMDCRLAASDRENDSDGYPYNDCDSRHLMHPASNGVQKYLVDEFAKSCFLLFAPWRLCVRLTFFFVNRTQKPLMPTDSRRLS